MTVDRIDVSPTPATLLKSVVVLDLDDADVVPFAEWSQVQFTYEDGDGVEQESLFLSFDKWKDLGKPKHLTITIEPGDLLNP